MNRPFKIACAAAFGLVSVAAIGDHSAAAATCAVDAVAIGGRAATACGGVFDVGGAKTRDQIAPGLFAEFGVDAPWDLFGASNDGDDSVASKGGAKGGWRVDFGGKLVDAFVIGLKSGDAVSVFLFDKLDPATMSYSGSYDAMLAGLIGDGSADAKAVEKARQDLIAAEKTMKAAEKNAKAAKKSDDKAKAKDAARRYAAAEKDLKTAEKALKKAEKNEAKRRSHDLAQRQFNGFGEAPQIIVGTFPTASSNVAAAVPAPAALPLMASAFALIGGLAWRRRRAAAE